MRPLLDDAEKDDFAAGEVLLGAGKTRSEDGRDGIRGQYRSPRLAIVELDNEVLIAPHRDKQASRIRDAFEDPERVTAAQTGALEAGMGIKIGRLHMVKLT